MTPLSNGAPFEPCNQNVGESRERSRHLLFETIIEEAFSEIYVFDAESLQLLLANKSARRNLGYSQDEISQLSVAEIKPEFSVARLREIYRPLIEGEVPRIVVHTSHKRKSNTRYPVEVHSQISMLNDRAVIFQIALDQTESVKQDSRDSLLDALEKIAARSRSADDFLQGTLDLLCAEWKWPVGHVYTWRAEIGALHSSEIWHFKDNEPWHAEFRTISERMTFESGFGFPGRVHAQQKAVFVPELSRDSTFPRFFAAPTVPLRGALGIPIFSNNEVAAVIELFSERPRPEDSAGYDDIIGVHISRLYERKCAEEQLEETNERLDAAIRGADVGFWDYNYRTGKFFMSPRCREILQLSGSFTPVGWGVFGKNIHPQDRRAMVAAVRAHRDDRKPYDTRYRYRLPDGEYIWLRMRAQGVWNERGEIIRTAGVLYDLPKELESEYLRRDLMPAMTAGANIGEKIAEALTIARRYLAMSSGIVSHVVGDEYHVIHGSSTIDSVAPGARLSLAEMVCSDVYLSDDVCSFEKLGASRLANHPGRHNFSIESYIGSPIFVRGTRFGMLCFWSSAPRERGFSSATIAVVRLVAQWIGAEIGRASELSDLLESDVRKSANLAAVGDALLTLDDAGYIEDANAAASALFSADDGALRGIHFSKLLPAAHAIVDSSGRPSLVKGRQEVAVRRDGQHVAILVSISEITLADRHLFTAALTDLTAIKQAETAKREFVSVVSHELRTPLTSIRGALGVIASQKLGPLNPAVSNMVHIAQRNSERLTRLVDDILDIEKLETGKLELTLRPLSVEGALSEALVANAAYAARFGVEFKLVVDSDLPQVVADSDRLLQVMANLLSNAAKFTRPNSVVTIEARRNGKWAKVSVQDQGAGISPQLQPRLFEKFSQGDHSNTRQREGSGLGLSITKQLLKLMNGDIGFVSTPDEGTIFYFRLPLARETAFTPSADEVKHADGREFAESVHVA